MDKPLREFLTFGIPGGIGIVLGIALPGNRGTEKAISLLGGAGLLGYGAWRYYEGYQKPTWKFPIQVTDPSVGERWSGLIPHTVDVTVNNPYENPQHLWVGATTITGTGKIIDFPVKEIDIQPGVSQSLSWWFKPSLTEGEDWKLISSIWDVEPQPGVTEQHRVGDSGWIPFKVVWI